MEIFDKYYVNKFYTLNDFPDFKLIENNYNIIKNEYVSFINKYPNPPEVSNIDNKQIPLNTKGWKMIMLKCMNKDHLESYFPNTLKIINTIDDIVTCFFSILDPGKKINPHVGYYSGYLRYHLGIDVPDPTKAFLNLDGSIFHWYEGKSVIFNDRYSHYVENNGNKKRCVLFIDFKKPLPYEESIINDEILSSLKDSEYIQNIEKNIQNVEKNLI